MMKNGHDISEYFELRGDDLRKTLESLNNNPEIEVISLRTHELDNNLIRKPLLGSTFSASTDCLNFFEEIAKMLAQNPYIYTIIFENFDVGYIEKKFMEALNRHTFPANKIIKSVEFKKHPLAMNSMLIGIGNSSSIYEKFIGHLENNRNKKRSLFLFGESQTASMASSAVGNENICTSKMQNH